MSLHNVVLPVWRIACDYPGCKRYEQNNYEFSLRPDAARAGWRVRPHKGKGSRTAPDLCPDHADAAGVS